METRIKLLHGDVTGAILGNAIDVHTRLGPGLLESAYKSCLAYKLSKAGLAVRCEAPIHLDFDELHLECAYRADMIVEEKVIVELKATEALQRVHESQLLTYMKLTNLRVGLLLNFNARTIPLGLKRLVL